MTSYFLTARDGGETLRYGDGYYRVPKRDLMIRLQVLLQREELQIAAALQWRKELMEEMRAMEVKRTSAGLDGNKARAAEIDQELEEAAGRQ